MPRLVVLLLAVILAGCGLLGPDPGDAACGFGRGETSYHAHTTLGDAGLPTVDVPADSPGDLWVSANEIELPHGVLDSSQPPPMARVFCFHPDSSNETLRGALPSGWSPPDSR
jgi:hypothetical protein